MCEKPVGLLFDATLTPVHEVNECFSFFLPEEICMMARKRKDAISQLDAA